MAYSKYNLPTLDYVSFFGNDHSYTTYGLIRSNVEVETPKLKTSKISTFYTQGAIDVTDSISSVKHYDNRKISMTFKVEEDKTEWKTIYKRVMEELHGMYSKRIYISGYDAYYEGRLHVNKFKTNENTGEIVIDVDAKPWVLDVVLNYTYTYTFDGRQIQDISMNDTTLANTTIKKGDIVYYKGEERFITAEGLGRTTETKSSGSKTTRWKIGEATADVSHMPSIVVRTTESSASYLAKNHSVTLLVLRRIEGW